MLIRVGVLCRIFVFPILFFPFSRLNTAVGEERTGFSATCIYYYFNYVVSALSLGAQGMLRYLVVALPWPSIFIVLFLYLITILLLQKS